MPSPFHLGRYCVCTASPTQLERTKTRLRLSKAAPHRRQLVCVRAQTVHRNEPIVNAKAPHGLNTRNKGNGPRVLDPAAPCSTIYLDLKLYE